MSECQCIPWDMIRPNGTDHIPMCERYGNGCFYYKMKNVTHVKKSCYCLPQCNSKIYQQSSVEKVPLDMAQICKEFPDLSERMTFMQLKYQDFEFYFDEYSKLDYLSTEGEASWQWFTGIRNFYGPFSEPIWKLINMDQAVPNRQSFYQCDSDYMKNLFAKDVVVIEIQMMDQSYQKGLIQVKFG